MASPKKTNRNKISSLYVQFKIAENIPQEIIKRQSFICENLLKFLEITIEQNVIHENPELENFIGENLASIFEFIHHNKQCDIDKKRLKNIFHTYMALGSDNTSVYNFWERFSKEPDFIFSYHEIFIPVIKTLLLSGKTDHSVRSLYMLQHIFVSSKICGGFSPKRGMELYDSALKTFLYTLDYYPQYSIEQIQKHLEAILQSLFRPRQKFQLVPNLQEHLEILDSMYIKIFTLLFSFLSEKTFRNRKMQSSFMHGSSFVFLEQPRAIPCGL